MEINKLVVIDNDKIHNFLAKRLIDKLNITNNLLIINTPAKAMTFFEESCIKKTSGICPEIVLLDFNFPSMDAIELLKKIENKGLVFDRSIILFIISVTELKTEIQETLRKLGANGFLVKPIKEDEIIKLLHIYYAQKPVL